VDENTNKIKIVNPVTAQESPAKQFRVGLCGSSSRHGSLVGPWAHEKGAPLVVFACQICRYDEIWEHRTTVDKIGRRVSAFFPLQPATAKAMGVSR
jgi:hypothetical protein